jgi:nitrate reductase gamma subunit
MFAVELVAVAVREAFPAFGLTDVWRIPGHPVRLAFDFAYDATGLMILVGCLLALVFRWMVHGTPEQKYTDTPTTVFLLAVVLGGFVLEGLRLAMEADQPGQVASFVGLLFAAPMRGVDVSPYFYEGFWYFHVLLSCAFIAYVPVKRLIHSCATPLGRMMNSQKAMLAAKKERSLRGLLGRGVLAAPVITENKIKRV